MEVEVREGVERSAPALECTCHGYAAEDTPTQEEYVRYACSTGRICCVAAFVCRACGKRIVAKLAAPEA